MISVSTASPAVAVFYVPRIIIPPPHRQRIVAICPCAGRCHAQMPVVVPFGGRHTSFVPPLHLQTVTYRASASILPVHKRRLIRVGQVIAFCSAVVRAVQLTIRPVLTAYLVSMMKPSFVVWFPALPCRLYRQGIASPSASRIIPDARRRAA